MATAKQILALLAGHVQGDNEQVLSVALQVAAAEARQGRKDVADELKRLVDRARSTKTQGLKVRGRQVVPLVRPSAELEHVLAASYPHTRLDDMVLPQRTRVRLDRVVRQQRQRETLREHAQKPISHVLLVGPPGTGKSMTAAALAGELHLPLFRIQLDTLINRFMGETAAKLRLVFDQVGTTRGVYLFDEFDALGTQRSLNSDVGEMRRVLNSFLQFLEEETATDSLVVGATNHPEFLDRALVRRLGEVLEYGLPDEQAAREVIQRRLERFDYKDVDWGVILPHALGLSQGELGTAADETAKDAILEGVDSITTQRLIDAISGRRSFRESLSHP